MLLAFFYLVIFISGLKNEIVQCIFIPNIKIQGIFNILMHVYGSHKHYLQTPFFVWVQLEGCFREIAVDPHKCPHKLITLKIRNKCLCK